MRLRIVVLLLLAVSLRCINLDERPLQFDEGVNYSFVRAFQSGSPVVYRAENFHGPLFFYLVSGSAALFSRACDGAADGYCLETTETGMRAISLLAGVLLCLTPFLLSGIIGGSALFHAGIFLAASTPLVFLSQVAIHEMVFTFLAFAMVLTLFRYLSGGRALWLFVSSVLLGLLVVTKENWVYIAFAVFIASIVLRRSHGGQLPVPATQGLFALFLFLLPFGLFFPGHGVVLGITEFFHGIFSWRGKALQDVSQFAPWTYYFSLLFRTDCISLLFLFLIPVGLWRERSNLSQVHVRAALFLFLCGSIIFAILTVLPYKTPWLIVNVTPFLLAAGVLLFFNQKHAPKIAVFLALIVILQHWYLRSLPVHPLQPVASYEDVRTLAREVVSGCKADSDCQVLVAIPDQWPLPFYLQPIYERVGYALLPPSAGDLAPFRYLIFDWRVPQISTTYRSLGVYTIHGRRKVQLWVVK